MRHLGRIQRAILKRVEEGDADFYALEDLANWISHRPDRNARRQAVLGAARSLVRRYPKQFALTEDETRPLIVGY